MKRVFFLFLALASATSACKPNNEKTTANATSAPAPFATRFDISLDKKIIHVQIALTELEIQNGLMRRSSLDENEGMLFVFPKNEKRSFWMKNVPINLAVGYFSENGKLDEIKKMLAFDTASVPSRSNQIRFVLEMNEGWFEKNDTEIGAQLDLAALETAINARGFRAKNFLPQKN